ncbi:hypothetical protein CAPTEDRAFT_197002, partial [Capitella teleta]
MTELKDILKLMLRQREEDQAQRKQDLEMMQDQLRKLVDKLQPADPAATHTVSTPSFSPFDSTSELWDDYYVRFCTFAGAHSVPAYRRAQVFLTNQPATTYKLLVNLAKQAETSKNINDLTMDEIVHFMKDHFDPKRFIVRERF